MANAALAREARKKACTAARLDKLRGLQASSDGEPQDILDGQLQDPMKDVRPADAADLLVLHDDDSLEASRRNSSGSPPSVFAKKCYERAVEADALNGSAWANLGRAGGGTVAGGPMSAIGVWRWLCLCVCGCPCGCLCGCLCGWLSGCVCAW